MKPKTPSDWKKYYLTERNDLKIKMENLLREERENINVRGIIEMKGIISFPHTFLNDNLPLLTELVYELYRSDIERVVALGVQHGSDLEHEFSLDNFIHLNEFYSKIHNLSSIEIIQKYNSIWTDIKELEEEGKSLRESIDRQTAIVMTGDLSHYGHGYGTLEIKKNYEEIINENIKRVLKLVYHDKNHKLFKDLSMQNDVKNDQIAPSIIVSSFLGANLDFKIFSSKLSDYSKVMDSEKPTVVASVFYGVFKKE